MNEDEIIKLISREYSPLSEVCSTELLSYVQFLTEEKNTHLVREGQYSDKLFFIIKGCARAYYLRDGKDVSDWFAFENEFISSINSFFQNIPSPHSIEVLDDSILLMMNREDVDKLCDKHPDFERLSKIIITKTLLKLQDRIASMQFQTAEQKYNNLLQLYPNITQRIPLTHIASYLGITLETLSRIRKLKS